MVAEAVNGRAYDERLAAEQAAQDLIAGGAGQQENLGQEA